MLESPTSRAKSGFLKLGSSNWTRTSDIRINSPPFYRLNYGGIASFLRTKRILTILFSFVKAENSNNCLFAENIDLLWYF
ncbi:hypothetical protein XBJ1_1903 [Xenorhabdus bovienii SS-2004]|uniref:Uncharacterized protein n=1 Tax=Xenorhabdus bovienii (strain SS-2004) TaxID=406818 RepID=D3V2R4_XENBS|nr:hypothetical protein XBJ1_1903 [Xenorhabdus bovienii SS-2004]